MKKKEKSRGNIIQIFTFLILGFLSGIFYFGGLWLTLQYMNRFRFPVVVTLASYIIRSVVAFFVLVYIARLGQWIYILYWLAGFIVARILLSRLLGRNLNGKNKKE